MRLVYDDGIREIMLCFIRFFFIRLLNKFFIYDLFELVNFIIKYFFVILLFLMYDGCSFVDYFVFRMIIV